MHNNYQIFTERPDLSIIAELIEKNSKVIDLGCGDGSLLDYLTKAKGVTGSGIELYQDMIIECVKKGVSVVHDNLNNGLSEIKDKTFDYAILSQTLQSVDKADDLLKEMARVGKKVLVSFINFGFYKARLQLMFCGKMPVTKSLPYQWYNTPNIHLGTINDFRTLCDSIGLKIIKQISANKKLKTVSEYWPNLFAITCVFMIEEK
ncbi:MAG TPA: methionine biosynthesis protein MetW [Lentisphaeria bacterium]|nr:MAG: methionine biosynthesis protein MetW [Lentisphaerae bacterium GWF2_38_69]HBM14821.1 methionine biosynthesis protein MetW [Lentisphaeria bacterium]